MKRSSVEIPLFRYPPVYLLVGGRGTRLGALCDDCPKPMLPVANRPFLDFVVRFFYRQGTRYFIFLTGYKGDQVEAYWAQHPLPHARFDFVHEPIPLGTGGAVSAAIARHPIPGLIIVANGDSLVPFHLETLLHAAQEHAGAVLAVETEDASRFGTLDIDQEKTLIAFREKTGHPGLGLVNAGIYCLQSFLLESLPLNRPLSIEKDLFPSWIAAGASFKIIPVKGPLLDIGTPQSLACADEYISNFTSEPPVSARPFGKGFQSLREGG